MTHIAHCTNTRNDERILALRMKHGAAGYGIYIMLIEKLYATDSHSLALDYKLLAYDIHAGVKKIQSVVEDFGLFEISADGTKFCAKPLCNVNSENPAAHEKVTSATNDIENIGGIKFPSATGDVDAEPADIFYNYDFFFAWLCSTANMDLVKRFSDYLGYRYDQFMEYAREVVDEWKETKPEFKGFMEAFLSLYTQIAITQNNELKISSLYGK